MKELEKPNSEKQFDQQKHPELQEGEIWVTNSDMNELKVGWKTARVGTIAYNSSGEVVEGLKPVFAKKEEVEKGKKIINNN
ncbi:MAG: hypothetical protein AAB575_01705 [Patescibacteria group bacterium]